MFEILYKKKRPKSKFLFVLLSVVCLESQATPLTNEQVREKLEIILGRMEKKFKVVFVYDAAVINKNMNVELDTDNLSMQQALTLLENKGIASKVIGDKVVLTRQPEKAVPQQEVITAKGRVAIRAENGDASFGPGITVVEKGTNNGVATDTKGNFSIKVKSGATLVFSMVGYKTQEIKATAANPIVITLEENVTNLNQVVVTGYQTIDRKLFTGSAASLKASDVKRDGITDVSRMLEGRVAGVSVQNVSGTFGAAPKIRVRGATSITGDNKPLWVVDGIILEDVVNISNEQLSTGDATTLLGSSVAGLNPDDIESFQILKDAAATAMYGARAMNGVVVITTKKGRIGKPLVSYTGNFSTYIKPTYNDFNIMNSADQVSLYKSMEDSWLKYGETSNNKDGGVFTKLAELIADRKVIHDEQHKNEFLKRYAKANTDWFDVLFRNSLLQEHSISISSGTEKSQLYFSTSFMNDNGWTVGDKVKRFTGNARANFNITPKFNIGLITQGSIRDQRAPGSIGRVSNPVEGKFDRDFDINPFSYAINSSRALTAYDENGKPEYFRRNYAPFNILNELQNNTLDLTMVDLKLQGEATYKITPTLKYSFLGALRYAKTNREHKVRENSNMAMAYRANQNSTIADANKFLYRNPDDPEARPEVVLPYGGFYNTNDDYLVSYNVRNSLEWSKTYNNKHIFLLYGSQELRYADRQTKFSNGYGYQFDKGGVPYVDPRIVKQAVESNFDFYGMGNFYDRFLAYMANGAYSYNGKYNLNGTIRYDGSNLLGKSNTARWLPTWNISGSWNVDTEDFMKQQSLITRLTARATYGLTASLQGKTTNSSLITRSSRTNRPYLPEIESVINITDLENRELTWEKQYETNLGIDLGMFQNRLSVTVDVYKRDGFDLISPIRTSGIGGQFRKNANYADMKSKGIELTLGGTIIQQKDWGFRSQLTVAWNENKITNLKTNPIIWELVAPDGGPMLDHPYRGLYSVDFQGLSAYDGTPTFINEKGVLSNNVNLQSDIVKYLKYDGPVDPKVTGGFFNSLRYKDLTLSALITFSAGNKIRMNPIFDQKYNDLAALPKEFLDRWQQTGDEKYTDIPALLDLRTRDALNGFTPYNTYNYSSTRVADGGFIRLKQVSLNYSLPLKYINALGMHNASLSFVANNPLLIYADPKLKGQDPEFFQAGGVALPIPKQYTLSVKVGF
jgi:TonB-linked SusC/RagA family outer membrane protein